MLINTVDPLVSFNAKLTERNIQTAQVITYKDWLRKALNPVKEGQEENYIAIHLKYLIQCNDDNTALTYISNLISLIKDSTIKFEDIDYYYDVLLKDKDTQRFNEGEQGKFELTVELESGYAYKSQIVETANRVGSKTINNAGNIDTPAIIEITPSIDLQNIIISGLSDDPITILNLTSGNTVIIDGEAGTVLQGGVNKFSDTDMWEFPKLAPGANTITFSQVNCDINIKYKPKWI